MKNKLSFYIRGTFVLLIIFSIATTFYVMIIKKDFDILTNPDGPDTSDYLEE